VAGNGYAWTFNGHGWSSAQGIDVAHGHAGFYGDNTGLNSVSCPTTHFCMAVDGTGYELVYNGATWSHPKFDQIGPLAALSCASPHFCAAQTNLTSGNPIVIGDYIG
jgi:hypothetical protein